MSYQKFQLGDKVSFIRSITTVYHGNDKVIHYYNYPVSLTGIIVGFTRRCTGKYIVGLTSLIDPEIAYPPFLQVDKRHPVYMVKSTLTGPMLYVLPSDLTVLPAETKLP